MGRERERRWERGTEMEETERGKKGRPDGKVQREMEREDGRGREGRGRETEREKRQVRKKKVRKSESKKREEKGSERDGEEKGAWKRR